MKSYLWYSNDTDAEDQCDIAGKKKQTNKKTPFKIKVDEGHSVL